MPRKGLIAGLVALLFAAQIFIRFQSSLIHDAAWYLYVAQGLLHGKKLYINFVEVNPPLGMWLVVPPVWIAERTGFASGTCLYSYLFALTAMALALCWRYAKTEMPSTRALMLVATSAILLFAPGNNFGQREHYMVLMFLPWVMLRMQRAPQAKGWERVLVGVAAGLAIALKPHAIFAPLCVEAMLCFQQRNWRQAFALENIAAVVAVLAYGLAIAIFTPEFFDGIISLGRTAYLPYYGYPLPVVLMDAKWAVIFMVLGLLGISDKRVQIYWAAALGFFVSYFLQNKGFTYHILPATIFALLACTASLQANFATPRLKTMATGIIGLAGLALLISEPQAYEQNRDVSSRIEALRGPEVHSIFIASNRFSHAFPYVVERHLDWASRLPTQWLAPYVSDYWKPGESTHDPIVAKALDWTMEDFANLKPDLVAIDNTKAQRDAMGGFEFLKFWNEDPRFAAQWQNYRLASDQGDILIYQRQK
jgi:hypothetical protein